MEIENGIIGFTEEKKQVAVDGKEYVVRNLTPIYRSEEDRERVKRRIENTLYNIFSKYMSITDTKKDA